MIKRTFIDLSKNNILKKIPFIVLVVEIMLFSIVSPHFHNFANIRNILMLLSIDGLVAIGLTFVLISGGIDLSIGINKGFSAVISILTLKFTGSIILAFLAALSTGFIVGLINGIIITKGRVNPFIATLGTYLMLNGLILVVTKESTVRVENINFLNVSNGMLFFINFPIWVFLLLILVMRFLLNRTVFGRYIFAIGGNEQVCSLFGLNVDKIKTSIYAVCGSLCGLAGFFLSARAGGASPIFGQYTMFIVVGAVVLGGTSIYGGVGSVIGSVIGLAIYMVLQNAFGIMNIDPFFQFYTWGTLLILVAVFDSLKHRRDINI